MQCYDVFTVWFEMGYYTLINCISWSFTRGFFFSKYFSQYI